jgi:hypothetical protein
MTKVKIFEAPIKKTNNEKVGTLFISDSLSFFYKKEDMCLKCKQTSNRKERCYELQRIH